MIELSVSEAQGRFTKLLSQAVTIVDRKSHKKRAVLLPFDMYEKLVAAQNKNKVYEPDEELEKFVGILKDTDRLSDDDPRLQAILR